jgi:hypothetical protein
MLVATKNPPWRRYCGEAFFSERGLGKGPYHYSAKSRIFARIFRALFFSQNATTDYTDYTDECPEQIRIRVIREIRGHQSSPLPAVQIEFGCGFAVPCPSVV